MKKRDEPPGLRWFMSEDVQEHKPILKDPDALRSLGKLMRAAAKNRKVAEFQTGFWTSLLEIGWILRQREGKSGRPLKISRKQISYFPKRLRGMARALRELFDSDHFRVFLVYMDRTPGIESIELPALLRAPDLLSAYADIFEQHWPKVKSWEVEPSPSRVNRQIIRFSGFIHECTGHFFDDDVARLLFSVYSSNGQGNAPDAFAIERLRNRNKRFLRPF
jgi:hypothetical protein